MGTKEKLIERFKSQPNDFTFDEMEKLLSNFGYVKSIKGKTSGSRVIYKNEDKRPIMLHKPHPGNLCHETGFEGFDRSRIYKIRRYRYEYVKIQRLYRLGRI